MAGRSNGRDGVVRNARMKRIRRLGRRLENEEGRRKIEGRGIARVDRARPSVIDSYVQIFQFWESIGGKDRRTSVAASSSVASRSGEHWAAALGRKKIARNDLEKRASTGADAQENKNKGGCV